MTLSDPLALALDILLAGMGIYALIKGQFPLSADRRVLGIKARLMGVLLLAAVALSLFEATLIISALLFIVAVIYGFVAAENVKKEVR